ncbi:PREDICTED: uncharacterized protein LOC104593919 [Nelumbo nucifera]|uniref:Uncharacterized protein LOC104593919 n=1 Tax=Nelumbo nucifera TaxID=4432 RepID=A0A1U7ZTQ1_NELNU|nr:PREDICTED: uncharacterized protein LOC104593919 [Nelumbo nucifera]
MASLAVINQASGFVSRCNAQTKSSASVVSVPLSGVNYKKQSRGGLLTIRAETMATEKMGIKIEKNPPEAKLTELGVRSWPKWGCPPSKFPWTYDAKETCYLLKGKVKVYPDGYNDFVEFGAGDLVEFPKGMKCTWDVSEAVDKHYNFE